VILKAIVIKKTKDVRVAFRDFRR